jgi:hypothetical protein
MQEDSESVNKIKKFKSAYILFSEDYRKKLKSENIKISSQEITKQIAENWKILSISKKNEYLLKEQFEREIFLKKKKEIGIYKYNKNHKLLKPKRFRTAFMFFMMSHREDLQHEEKFKNIDMIKSLSERWNLMKEEEKREFELLAISDKLRYDNEMDLFINHVMLNKQKRVKKKEKIQKMNVKLKVEDEEINEIKTNDEKNFLQKKKKKTPIKFPFSIIKAKKSVEKNILERGNISSDDEEDYLERNQMGEICSSSHENMSETSPHIREQSVLQKSYNK